MHFSHLRFWLLVQIWKFDWFLKLLLLTFNCYFIAYLITENVEKKKNFSINLVTVCQNVEKCCFRLLYLFDYQQNAKYSV